MKIIAQSSQTILSFLLVLSSTIPLSSCSSQKDKIVGIWRMESDCIQNGTKFSLYSKVEFFRDGNYSTDGRIIGVLESGRKTNNIVLSYKDNGNWSISDNIITDKIIDFKVNLEYVTINGSMTEGKDIDQRMREELISNSEKHVEKGIGKNLSIIKIDSNEIHLKYNNEDEARRAGSCENRRYKRMIG
jgi:hypothetical protein